MSNPCHTEVSTSLMRSPCAFVRFTLNRYATYMLTKMVHRGPTNDVFMNKITNLKQAESVDTLVDNLCSRVLFSGLTKTLLEASSEQAATEAVQNLRTNNHIAYYCFNKKHSTWHITVLH